MISAGGRYCLDRQLAEIAGGILSLTDPTDSASVFEGEVIRPHPTVTGPAHKTVYDPVLASLLQHADRLLVKPVEGE